MEEKLLFTPAALLDFLLQVEELRDQNVSLITDTDDGSTMTLIIGDSTYVLKPQGETEVVVEDETLDNIQYSEEEALMNMSDDDTDVEYDEYLEEHEPVESGIIKEVAKTLLIGGMVRLTNKLLKGKDTSKKK